MAKDLFYGDNPNDQNYEIEPYDEVLVRAGDLQLPANVKKVLPRSGKVVVSFEGLDPVLDLIMLRKTATVPASALDLVRRGM